MPKLYLEMSGLCLIGVMLATFSASASLYSTSTDYEQQKNVVLNDEAVAAYFKKKFETEDVKPAMVMEYLVKLMGSKKKGGDKKKDETCINEGTDISLKKSQLEMILNTVYPQFGSQVFTTLMTPNHGRNMYITETHPLNGYYSMLNDIEQSHIEDTGNIWTNYSPCPTCVLALMDHYNKPGNDKPTIHVARIYTESNKFNDAVLSLQCLAKLEHVGFSILPWDFNAFKQYISESCANEIDERDKGYFSEEYMKLGTQLEFIHQLSQNTHANSWCDF